MPAVDVWQALDAHRGRFTMKVDTFPDAHHRHFSRFQGTDLTFLEIGVYAGGSLEMWRSYFGPQARIAGMDIDPACKALEQDGFDIFIGDQADRGFLREVADELGRLDVVSDDGGHRSDQQIASFEELFPRLEPTGVYACEDVFTSYLPKWGDGRGGRAHTGSFIDHARGLVDELYAWCRDDVLAGERVEVGELARTLRSVHFYGGLVIFEKDVVEAPRLIGSTGTGTRIGELELDKLDPPD